MITAILSAPTWADSQGDSRGAQPVLVELFTSQGCSSCPPADAFMHELAARDDVIALALHVDYWDYIFKDVFGKPAYTKRQYGYADAAGRRMVYTPQMIINGSDDVVGNRPQDVNALIARHRAAPQTVALDVRREKGQINITARALAVGGQPLVVQMARFIPRQDVAINSGENAGHVYAYANIVTDLQELGRWDPAQPLSLRVQADGDAPVVIILQRPGFGAVEAAALLR
ncbi:DUF1223 domain-containing protein [Roseovarius sp. M141]|nr:DUF1223 domain-containing protein [Roseovarius sp. M141]